MGLKWTVHYLRAGGPKVDGTVPDAGGPEVDGTVPESWWA